MATKKNQSALNDAGRKVGKALARSGHTVEETGQKMKKAAEKIVKDAAKKAEKTVESAIGTIKAELSSLSAQTKLIPSGCKKEVSELTHKKPAGAAETKAPLFKPGKGMTVEGQIGFLAGDIFEYLCENGTTPVMEIAGVMKKQGSMPLFGAALGWLAREAKISFSPCGTKVSIL
ncbi:MAG: winged helix-turn-helix domain-containing protein [Desulfurivibrionaceae bacterium]|jgi:vacuolar-type H+-ATPase subunit H